MALYRISLLLFVICWPNVGVKVKSCKRVANKRRTIKKLIGTGLSENM